MKKNTTTITPYGDSWWFVNCHDKYSGNDSRYFESRKECEAWAKEFMSKDNVMKRALSSKMFADYVLAAKDKLQNVSNRLMDSIEQVAFKTLAKKLNAAGYSYEDTSYVNDATGSLMVTCVRVVDDEVQEFNFQVYIPNSDIQDPENECFNTYAVTEEGDDVTVGFYQADDVVGFIQDLESAASMREANWVNENTN
mgnify:CR=1 FL=1